MASIVIQTVASIVVSKGHNLFSLQLPTAIVGGQSHWISWRLARGRTPTSAWALKLVCLTRVPQKKEPDGASISVLSMMVSTRTVAAGFHGPLSRIPCCGRSNQSSRKARDHPLRRREAVLVMRIVVVREGGPVRAAVLVGAISGRAPRYGNIAGNHLVRNAFRNSVWTASSASIGLAMLWWS